MVIMEIRGQNCNLGKFGVNQEIPKKSGLKCNFLKVWGKMVI
jgi:hypothetical protein